MSERLRQLGIHSGQARSAALFQLATDLPATVLRNHGKPRADLRPQPALNFIPGIAPRSGASFPYQEAYAKYAYTPNFRPYFGLTPRSRHAAPGDRQRLPLPVER